MAKHRAEDALNDPNRETVTDPRGRGYHVLGSTTRDMLAHGERSGNDSHGGDRDSTGANDRYSNQ